jgi:hypothetical protein
MKILVGIAMIIAAAGLALPANAQFIDDNVNSDHAENTGLGSQALSRVTGSVENSCVYNATNGTPSTCAANTALGYEALQDLVTGSLNTAIGASSLSFLTDGVNNTAVGWFSLTSSDGSFNTAIGAGALYANEGGNDGGTTPFGSSNTGVGAAALLYASTGNDNTAVGATAMNGQLNSSSELESSGAFNTAVGAGALFSFITASNNTVVGYDALYTNNAGTDNSALGYEALYANTGSFNTAMGYEALFASTASYNTALGYESLLADTTGQQNTAVGVSALHGNKAGNFNTAAGVDALYSNTSGASNIAVGYKSGYDLTTGKNNIDIGNIGAKAESGTIRIGTSGTQTATYVAGITGVALSTGSPAPVYVNSSGQLGMGPASSERFKTSIAPMGESTEKLAELRPVTFQYKSDPHGARQYGLIAEEVAKVYPELVIRDAKGQILTVHYDELAPMLLNVVQKQEQRAAQQAEQIRALQAAVVALQASHQGH